MDAVYAEERFRSIIGSVERRRIPLWAHVDLTFRCNLSCAHCYCRDLSADYIKDRAELSTGEVTSLLDSLADAGSLYLILSGGEILTRPDIFSIVEHARRRTFVITLFTNGTLLDARAIRTFRELAVGCIEMSVYGVTREVHDGITGVPGSFEAVAAAARLVRESGIRLVLKSVIMKQNFSQARSLPAFCYARGADDFHYAVEICPKNDGSRSTKDCQLEYAQMEDLLRDPAFAVSLEEFSGAALEKPLCGCGQIGCSVSPYGDVYPCAQMMAPIGSIRTAAFSEIWHGGSALLDEVHALQRFADIPACRECADVAWCRKCIGLSLLETGDMRACYPTLKELTRINRDACKRRQ